jgi:hypothetical protein
LSFVDPLGFSGCGVTHVVMEYVYWLPVWGLLEGVFALMLVNPSIFAPASAVVAVQAQTSTESVDTIPGINLFTASTLIAELGAAMQQFPDAMHLGSWAGLCPGDCERAGKRKNTRKGNLHVRRVLCQAAWVAAHTKPLLARGLDSMLRPS